MGVKMSSGQRFVVHVAFVLMCRLAPDFHPLRPICKRSPWWYAYSRAASWGAGLARSLFALLSLILVRMPPTNTSQPPPPCPSWPGLWWTV